MASGSYSKTYSNTFTVKTNWTSTSSSATNKSTITANHYLVCGTYGALYISGRTNSCKVNGETKNFSSAEISTSGGSTIPLGTTTHTVTHNSDGKKSVSASTTFNIKATINNTYVESIVASGTMKLDDIPRASSVSGGSGNIGSETTINISRAVDTFTHTLKYEFGSLTGTIASDVETSYKWTIPTSFYGQVINSNTGTGKIICETYNGTTLMGTKEVEFTAKVINSNPVVGTFTYKDNNAVTTEITKDNQRIIRNNSILLFTIGNATAKNSATISKYEVTFNDETKSLTSAGTINFGTINLSSNSTAILKVIDSRGNTTTKEVEIIIDNWELPNGIVSARRKNNFYSDTILKVDGTYSDLNGKNTMAIQYICRRVDLKESSYDGNLEDNVEKIVELDNNYQWHIQFFISDRIGQTTYNVYIDRGIPLIFFDRLLNSVGINCFPSDGFKLDLNGNARATNLPIATGINNIESFDDVGEGGTLFKSGLYSVYVDNIWYHLLNIRHRNGITDGTTFGLQIRCRFSMNYNLEWRKQNAGTWSEWQRIDSIVESGTTENGCYVKYSDGRMEANMTVKGTTNISKAWGSLYISEDVKLPDFPVPFKERPTVNVSPQTQTGTQYILVGQGGSGSGDGTFGGYVALVRPNSRTGVAYILDVEAKGYWK